MSLTTEDRLARLEKKIEDLKKERIFRLTFKKGAILMKKDFKFVGTAEEAKLHAIAHCEKLGFIRFVHCSPLVFDLLQQEKDYSQGMSVEDGGKA